MSQQRKGNTEWKIWAGLLALVAAFVGVHLWLCGTPTDYQRVNLPEPGPPDRTNNLPEAAMTPGRVVELDTTKGRIDFVLFEKDCPITTGRIVELVKGGSYTNVKFDRVVKDELIQTAVLKKKIQPVGLEVLKGLINTKGAVGMARGSDPNSGTSSFYILVEPWRHLDYDYAVFGRLIRGMDVASKVKKGDSISSARVREITPEDRERFHKALEIETRRKTE